MNWTVYVLQGQNDKVYTGFTGDIEKRLKQHNGVMSGGAHSTKRYRPWTLACTVTGFESRKQALQFEYTIKHKRRGIGLQGRYDTILFHKPSHCIFKILL